MPPTPAITRIVDHLATLGQTQITAHLQDTIRRAELLTNDDARMMALDFNARLITALRERCAWPTTRTSSNSPCQ